MKYTPTAQSTQFVFTLVVALVSYAFVALLAGICGVFYVVPVIFVWAATLAALTRAGVVTWTLPPRDMFAPLCCAALAVGIVAATTVPSVFDGRDQGSLADAAIRLATTHTFSDHTPESDVFFHLYGRGQALNFPGYFYAADGALITQFPLPYTAFLAGWYGLLGVNGFVVANALLLLTTVIVIVYAARYFVAERWSTVLGVLLITSFPLLWFAKLTLSENLAGALLWSACTLLLMLLRKPSAAVWFALWTTVALLAVTRIEGVWFALFFVVMCVQSASVRTFVCADSWCRFFVPAALTAAIGIVTVITSMPFLITMAKVIFDTSSATTATPLAAKLTALFSVYTRYGLMIPMIASGALIGVVLWRWHKVRASLLPLLPLLLVAPLAAYYIFPHITADHPWMLRRYGFALVNATLFASVIFAAGIPGHGRGRRVMRRIIPACILIAQLPAFFYFVPYAENRTLAAQIATIGTHFTPNDLVLVDRSATGSGWAMMNTPLRTFTSASTVYIFNPDDITRINTTAFTNVYLIVSDDAVAPYTNVLAAASATAVAPYTITTSRLAPAPLTDRTHTFPRKQSVTVTGTIYNITPHAL